MASRGENCNNWPRTVKAGGCFLVAYAQEGLQTMIVLVWELTDNWHNAVISLHCLTFGKNRTKTNRNIINKDGSGFSGLKIPKDGLGPQCCFQAFKG